MKIYRLPSQPKASTGGAFGRRTAVVMALAILGTLGIGTTVYLHFHLHNDGQHDIHSAAKRVVELAQAPGCPPVKPCPGCPPERPAVECPACPTAVQAVASTSTSSCPECPPCKSHRGVVATTAAARAEEGTPCPAADAEYVHPCAKKTAEIRAKYTKGISPHVGRDPLCPFLTL